MDRRTRTKRNIVIGQTVDGAKVERALEMRRQPTPEEEMLWQHLRRNALGGLHFRRQQVIDGFIADFYCHTSGLVVEIDGRSHEGRSSYDSERDAILESRGLTVVRFSNDEVRADLRSVLARILEVVRQTELPLPRREGVGG